MIASDKEAISKGFDWVVEFAEVLAEGGFDIQVANPGASQFCQNINTIQ